MKNSIIALATAIFAMLLIGCAHKESEEVQTSDIQLAITAAFATPAADFAAAGVGVGDESAAENPAKSATRATTTAFESGDLLGLYAVKSGGELNPQSNLINNHQLKVSASGAITGVDLPAYYPDKSSSLDLFSYYPYQSGDATADALGVLVGIRTIQTDFSLLQASDLCYGRKLDAAPTAAPHPLQFSHSFAQLRLNFSLYEGCSAIASIKLLSIKDSAKLNLQTGAVTLLPHIADVNPFVNSADATNPLQFTAIIPAQSLSGPCVEITLADGTIYYYHATTPIALTASATNTLNLNIADRKVITASGAPAITAWGIEPSSAVLGDAVNNLITLYWLAPHASYASIDKITVSIVDIFNHRREVDVTPVIDPLSSAEYATLTFPLAIADAGYPQIIEGIKLYAGATLIRSSPREAILGSVLSRAGAHTLGLSLTIEITPADNWLNVSGYGESRAITVTVGGGATSWTASVEGAGLTVTPTSGTSGQTATLTWALHAADPAPATRSAIVTFATTPIGAKATITSTQNGIKQPANTIIINGLFWSTMNVGSSTPLGFGTYHDWAAAPAACKSLGEGWRPPTNVEFQAMHDAGLPVTYYNNGAGWSESTPGWIKYTHGLQFPAAGYRSNGSLVSVGTLGYYWSSIEVNTNLAYFLNFTSSSVNPQGSNGKTYELSVRCVQ